MDSKKGYALLGKTPAGKTIVCRIHPINGLYFISFLEGGELPKELLGAYTSSASAKTKVIAYLDRINNNVTKEKQAMQEAKLESDSRKGRGKKLHMALHENDIDSGSQAVMDNLQASLKSEGLIPLGEAETKQYETSGKVRADNYENSQ